MILIGSSAIKHHFPDFSRLPKDLDYAVDKHMINSKGIEYLYNPIIGHLEGVADPNVLYTLKISHLIGWDINWDKHMFDVQFLKSKGTELNKDLFDKLYSFWNKHHSQNRRSDLNMNADDFFNNVIKCEYDHDYLHTLLNPYPTFNYVLKEGAEVDVCEGKFNNLPFEQKCNLVTEEVMVMAYERFYKRGWMHAYSQMLKKFILNHAPIWEAIFIIENFKLLHKPKFNYFKKIEDGLSISQFSA
jgi:hypothetical protein